MATQRFYFEKETVTTVKEKGWIDIEMGYTQLYNCFSTIAPKIQSATTFKLLFWLLANKTNDYNGIDTSIHSFKEFNKHLTNTCGEEGKVGYRTFLRCMGELKESGALTQVGKGHYYANPNMFWQKELDERKCLLIEEQKDGNYLSLNPKSTSDDKTV